MHARGHTITSQRIEREAVTGLPVTRVLGGDVIVSTSPIVFTTTLGSCVAACVRDDTAGVFGINHFILPGGDTAHCRPAGSMLRYGRYAMDALFDALRAAGARMRRLVIRVFGGAVMTENSRVQQVGPTNAAFVVNYLRRLKLQVAGQDMGGSYARRLRFSSAETTVSCQRMIAVPATDLSMPIWAGQPAPPAGRIP